MSRIGKVGKSLDSAFLAVIHGNKFKSLKDRKSRKDFTSEPITRNGYVNIHGNGKFCSETPAVTLKLMRTNERNRVYCFNLVPSLSRHPRIRRSDIKGIFLTRTSWSNVAVGSLVTLSNDGFEYLDSNSNKTLVPFFGPPGFVEYAQKTRKFLFTKFVKEKLNERFQLLDDERTFRDEAIEVRAIPTFPKSSRDIVSSSFPTSSYLCKIPIHYHMKTDEVTNSEEESTVEHYEHTKSHDSELDVAVDDCFISVLDCPTNAHFDVIKTDQNWTKFQERSGEESMTAIFHLTPQKLFLSDPYQEWVEKFGSDCEHIMLNDNSRYCYSVDDYRNGLTMNKISPHLFPNVNKKFVSDAPSGDTQGHCGVSLCLHPQEESKVERDKSVIHSDDLESITSEIMDIDSDRLAQLKRVSAELDGLRTPDSDGYFPRLIALGTGGTHDHHYRAQPGFLLQLNHDKSILLDCGERTVERIHTICGEYAPQVLSSIKLILISHHHIDHHIGLINTVESIVKARDQKNEKTVCLMPLHMCGPYKQFLGDSEKHVAVCPLVDEKKGAIYHITKSKILRTVGIIDIIPAMVDHGISTYGLVIVTKCRKKIVYSSDTLPMSKELIRQGRGADILVHDCLYPDSEFIDEAKFRKHSWLDGVLATSDAMNAKFTLLTHFGPTYPMQPVRSIPEKYSHKVCPAFDSLSVSLADVHKLPHLLPAVESMYRISAKSWDKRNRRSVNRARRNAAAQQLASLIKETTVL